MRLPYRLARLHAQGGFSLAEQMAVVAVAVAAAAAVIPATVRTISSHHFKGDAHGIVSYLALAKMRSAAGFTKSRLFVDLSSGSYHLEIWQTTGAPRWVFDSGNMTLSPGVAFGFGTLAAAPPDTQAALAMAPPCQDNAGAPIGNTACIVFNSRGIPIDDVGTATSNDAVYITNGTGVYGATLSATSRVALWWSGATGASWMKAQ